MQKDDFFDLAIVDPQYGHGNQVLTNNNTRSNFAKSADYKIFDNTAPPDESYFTELKRVSKNQIIFGANHFADKFKSNSSSWLVWDKDNGNSSFADAELAYTSFDTAVRIFKYTWNGMHQGSYGGDVRLNEKRINPTQKPKALYRWILENYAVSGQRILDTHLGSASSAIAAYYFGVDFVGCEIDEEMFEKAKQRVNSETAQTTLF